MKYRPFKKIDLNFKFNDIKVQSCNFNLREELILFCIKNIDVNEKYKVKIKSLNIVCVYSIQTKAKCQKVYMIPKEADVISISKHDKICLCFNDYIHEWNLHTGDTSIMSANIKKVIINFKVFIISLNL